MYESSNSIYGPSAIKEYPEAKTATLRPEAQTPSALKALAEASAVYGAAAAAFMEARWALQEARAEWDRRRDIVAKAQEQENV